jgi:hypothetical protein
VIEENGGRRHAAPTPSEYKGRKKKKILEKYGLFRRTSEMLLLPHRG